MKLFFLWTGLLLFGSIQAQQFHEAAYADTAHHLKSRQYDVNNKQQLKLHSLIFPAGLIAYGCIAQGNNALKDLDHSTRAEITEDHPLFLSKADNYLQYAPAAAVYALNLVGIKGKNNFRDRTMIYGLTIAFSAVFDQSIKTITKVERPDNSGANSFPSGHTTTAFAAAEFLRMEYKEVSPWYGIAGYTVATATGVLRLYNNKHWVSDVAAGAGFGILSTKLAYWVYPFIKRILFKDKPVHGMILPYYQRSSTGLVFVYNFKH